jgi:hypothetical protein
MEGIAVVENNHVSRTYVERNFEWYVWLKDSLLPQMRQWTFSLLGLAVLIGAGMLPVGSATAQQQKVIVVVGAAGQAAYAEQFEAWASEWKSAVQKSGGDQVELTQIGLGVPVESRSDFDLLKESIKSTPKTIGELWVVLIGHGTDDRKKSKFNLRGPDVSASQLNEWLAPLPCRTVIINCSSASGSFIGKLKHPDRIVVTATKSAAQLNFARFGGYFSKAIADPAFDLDKDQQTSLLEAFLAASSQTQEFYVEDTRLATELAMVDDNGDGQGTPADWFKGVRVVKQAKKGAPDGFHANSVFLVRGQEESKLSTEQRKKRNELEVKLEQLRVKKNTMTEEAYYLAIEPVLLKLSRVYAEIDVKQSNSD